MIKKALFFLFSLGLLIYMVVPGTTSISDFPALPNSTKSTLSGDTYQIPNISAYFSSNYRSFVIPFYKNAFASKNTFGNKNIFHLEPIELNYPPEFAFTAIKDQTQSTYLEEFVYPLRDSVFVNGMEPFNPDGTPRYWGAMQFFTDAKTGYDTKVTLRYYPSSLPVRVLVWAGIISSVFFLAKVGKQVLGVNNG